MKNLPTLRTVFAIYICII